MASGSVIAWIPPSPIGLSKTDGVLAQGAPELLRVVGASGFGSEVVEVDELSWDDVTVDDHAPDVMLIGRDNPDRADAMRALMATYPLELVGNPIVSVVSDVESVMRIRKELQRTTEHEFDELTEARLVVIELDRFPVEQRASDEIAGLVYAIDRRGFRYGWSLLIVPSEGDSTFVRSLRIRSSIIRLYVLDGITASPDSGARITEALKNRLLTAAGVEEVTAGAPVAWVRAFERGDTTGVTT